ncbi:MAG: transcriptional regulator, partial [Chloroflexi bacterium]
MPLPTTVLRTKIIPPRNSPRTLIRPRLTEALIEAVNYRLTLVQAGAGYGKTSSLAALSETDYPLIWYQIMQEDSDPLVFLLHLCHATRQAVPDLADLPIPLLEAWDGTSSPLPTVRIFDQYLNSLSTGIKKPTLLVLDDIHHAASSTEIAHLIDRLVGLAPPDLHILLSGRPPLSLPNLSRWRSQGMVYSIDRSTLAFTAVEIAELFSQQYGYELTSDEAEVLYNATEGWAIALQLVWQNLRTQALASVDEVLANQAASLDSLFHILATEVFEGQPADVQEFLRISAILREMTPEACDALRGASDSAAMLAYLRRLDLFVVDLGDSSSRYHHIFHSFLQQFSDPRQRCEWHRTASSYYLSKEDFNEAIYHLYHAMDWERAASLLDSFGTQLLTSGRLDTLSYYLGGLTPEIL